MLVAVAIAGVAVMLPAVAGPAGDPTQPPSLLLQAPAEEAPETAEEEVDDDDDALPRYRDLRMVLTEHGEPVGRQSAFFASAWYRIGDQVAQVPLVNIRRYGADIELDGGREYVPVVDHGVEKRRRQPRELPGDKVQ